MEEMDRRGNMGEREDTKKEVIYESEHETKKEKKRNLSRKD